MRVTNFLFSIVISSILFSCKKDCDKDPVDTGTACQTEGFSKVYGGASSEQSLAVATTSDGGYITVGVKDQSGSLIVNDVHVVRVNNKGEKLWEKTFGGSSTDLGIAITTGVDGGFLVGAYTSSNDGDVEGNHGGFDVWLLKLNDNGDVVWKKTFGGTGAETFTRITKSADSYFVAAASNSIDLGANNGGTDIMLMKLNKDGNILERGFYGGNGNDAPGKLIATTDGGGILVGSTNSNSNGIATKGQTDVLVMKFNPETQVVWQKNYGGTLADDGTAVAAAGGGYIITAETHSSDGDLSGTAINGQGDSWAFKIDNVGNKVWSKKFSGSGYEFPTGVIPSSNGSFLISGYTNSADGDFVGGVRFNAYVIKINAAGEKSWVKTLGGTIHDYAYDIVKSDQCSFTIIGYSDSNDGDVPSNNGGNDVWIYKGKE